MKGRKGNSIRCCSIEGEIWQELTNLLQPCIQDGEVLAELGKWRDFRHKSTAPLSLIIISTCATILKFFNVRTSTVDQPSRIDSLYCNSFLDLFTPLRRENVPHFLVTIMPSKTR